MVRICSVLIMLLVNVTVFSQYITKGGELITIIDEAPIFKKKLDKKDNIDSLVTFIKNRLSKFGLEGFNRRAGYSRFYD